MLGGGAEECGDVTAAILPPAPLRVVLLQPTHMHTLEQHMGGRVYMTKYEECTAAQV